MEDDFDEDDDDVAYIGNEDDEQSVDTSLVFCVILGLFALITSGYTFYAAYTIIEGFAHPIAALSLFIIIPLTMFLGITSGVLATSAKYKAEKLNKIHQIPWLTTTQIACFLMAFLALLTAFGLILSFAAKAA